MKLVSQEVAGLKLKPGEKDKIFFDEALIGFGIRLRSDGGRLRRRWIVQYRDADGRTRRLKIGDADIIDAKHARKKALVALAGVAKGEDPQADKAQARRSAALTLKSVVTDYLAMKELELQRGEYRAASFRVTKLYLTGPYFRSLHAMAVSKIGLADVAACHNAIERNSGRVTAGRARSALSSMFTWAMQQGLMGAHPQNPVIATKKPKDATPRDRVLSDDELAAIWRGCEDDDFGKVVKLLMLTACRRDEIGGLRRNEINDDGTLILPPERVKNNHKHELPLTPLALSIIGTVPERVGRDHLFGDRSGKGFTRWSVAKDALDKRVNGEMTGQWRLHDIRRAVATGMGNLGVEPHIIEIVLDHFKRGDEHGAALARSGQAR